MEWIERLAKLYNLTVDAVLKALIEFNFANELKRTQFENFLKSKALSFITLTPSFTQIVLQYKVFNLLLNYSKSMGQSPSQAASDILGAFFKMESELQDGIYTYGKKLKDSEENSRSNPISQS